MLDISFTKDVTQFIKQLQAKQYKQVVQAMLELTIAPTPHNSKKLKGYDTIYRKSSGEFRIIYEFDSNSVSILLIDKRNDDEVYKKLGRLK